MAKRKIPLTNGEFYHICNRGVDGRNIFGDIEDVQRFLQSMEEFNVIDPIGSIYENSFAKSKLGSQASKRGRETKKLVNFVCYCLNPNHYHFILEQLVDRGIEKFMQKLGTGYVKYFNEKHKRSGSLFQGKFKSVHINSNTQLLHTSAYVNLNDRVHQLGSQASKLVRSSWDEYTGKSNSNFCVKDMVLGQFKNRMEYKKFAEETLEGILERRAGDKEVSDFLIE